MKKKNRLKKNKDIEKVIKKRDSYGNKYFVIYKIPNKIKLRVGISISKKYGNAVNRNKAKRRVRNILMQYKITNLVDLFVVIKPISRDLEFKDFQINIEKLLNKHKIIGCVKDEK